MPELIVLRHAKSDWSTGEPDLERPLARRGMRQAPEAGRWLATNIGTVVLVGHNPGVEDLVERLIGELVEMPTSAIAVVEVPGSWSRLGDSPAELRAAGRPPGILGG